MTVSFPDWFEAAIESQNAEVLRPRLIKHWDCLRLDLLPALESLHSIEKQQVMDCALWAGKYWQKDMTDRHRKGIAEIEAVLKHIAELAYNLGARINDLTPLMRKIDVAVDIPNLWDLLEHFIETDSRFSMWARDMIERGHWGDFCYEARRRQYDKPELSDVFFLLSDYISRNDNSVYSCVEKALSSRKSTADQLRVLLVQLQRNMAYPLRTRFTLPDKAIAALATALFDLDPPITADAVKTRRHHLASEG